MISFLCDGSNCPGLMWPVAESAHPDSCRAPYDDTEANLRAPSFPNLWRTTCGPKQLGAGNLRELVEALPVDDARCPLCHGKGYRNDRTCEGCGGAGFRAPGRATEDLIDDGDLARQTREALADRLESPDGRVEGVDRG